MREPEAAVRLVARERALWQVELAHAEVGRMGRVVSDAAADLMGARDHLFDVDFDSGSVSVAA